MQLYIERTGTYYKQIFTDVADFRNYLTTRQVDFVKCTVILWPTGDTENYIQPRKISCGYDAYGHGVLHVALSDYNLCFMYAALWGV
jgi:hypothetical protein